MSGNIPIKCFTCGKPIGHLIKKYLDLKREQNEVTFEVPLPKRIDDISDERTPDGKILDDLEVKRICCRSKIISFPSTLGANVNG
jgi:DNA-directed RNA polymerase subunit N (RpoN/RPB10)